MELNPICASLVERPKNWPWSSARAHIMGKDESGLLDMEWWNKQFTPNSWHLTHYANAEVKGRSEGTVTSVPYFFTFLK